VTAGVAIAAVALPIGVDYPAIAGLPPEVGLYASILSLSRLRNFRVVSAAHCRSDAATLTILGASLSRLAKGAEQQRIIAATAFAVAVRIVCLLAGGAAAWLPGEFPVPSHPHRISCGVSLTLLVGQIGRLTTVALQGKGVLRPLIEVSGRLAQIHAPTLFLGMGTLLL
jgi:MFS superfamily sulfate permease-like transporter